MSSAGDKDKKTAVLLIGFGGPTRMEEVRPFLMSIVDGSRVPESRIHEVIRHYELIGGKSPFNEITETQKKALEVKLKELGLPLPVGAAYRHSTPGFKDAFEAFRKAGVERVVGFVLASFRSFVSLQWYQQRVAEGRAAAGAESIEVVYTRPFDEDSAYHLAQEARMRESLPDMAGEDTYVIFTAHSIPASMCEQSSGENGNRCYGFQFAEAARGIARRLGIRHWTVCYQSRSGPPREAWLEPDVRQVIRNLKPPFERVLLVPFGFLCDNVEVIYDLDREAKEVCREKGLAYFRAGTVSDHPLFIDMIAKRVLEKVHEHKKLKEARHA